MATIDLTDRAFCCILASWKRPNTLQEAIIYFADPENCRQFMIEIRWPDGIVTCPTCGSEKVTFLQNANLYKCYGDHPKQKFSLKVGTIFEDSPLGLDKWVVGYVADCELQERHQQL